MRTRTLKSVLAGGVCALALTSAAYAADGKDFNVPAGELSQALDLYIRQSGEQLIYRVADVRGMKSPGVSGALSSEEALARLLEGTSLTIRRDPSGLIAVASMETQGPQGGSAGGAGAEVEGLIVTAQKREEDIQDVPIAMSAFSQEDLTTRQVAGGADLMTQVPNMTFTKTNFSSYSIQIRGIGTQAISATTDPAVAVAFNNAATIQNRFFEQEFYDMQRIEVLRGPQGTLYGRNATAGVVNLITQKPRYNFEAKASADVANYSSTRLEGMINIPLVEDRLALRLAGAWTKRDGFVTNSVTGQQIDGRDLWSTRLSLRFDPTDRISANFVWEHFEEDDDRLRSGKQLCKKAEFPAEIGGVPLPSPNLGGGSSDSGALGSLAYLSQGCLPASLYSEESFQTPNGYALPYYGPLGTIGFPTHNGFDVYLDSTQSRDLRVIESSYEPSYKAKTDVAYLSVDFDLTDSLTLTSETYYSTDELFSTQDFNRFSTRPGAFNLNSGFVDFYLEKGALDENGVFCDPQLGCSDRLTLGDLSTHEATQFGQEFRLSSDLDGPFNFNLGVNFVRYDAVNKYYVFVNSLTLFAVGHYSQNPTDYIPDVSDNTECLDSLLPGDPFGVYNLAQCIPVDPNPIGSLNDKGHNYFLSTNPYRLLSYAAFGEAYYDITPNLKITAGLRYTVDKKHAPRVPSWLLAGQSIGHPVAEVLDLEWREPTGRLAIDWKPDLAFTDETLLYASYAHGYKAGGANPPSLVFATYNGSGENPALLNRLQNFPQTFDAEFIDAYEIGSKNTLFDGRVTLNAAAFYYDYEGYQISEIIDRAALNRNFDAEIWGAEFEADWRPLENLKVGLKLGFEKTRVGDGQSVIDLMDRTAGNPDYFVIKPLPTMSSNCIIPVSYLQDWYSQNNNIQIIGLTTCQVLYYEEPGSVDYGVDGFDPSTVPNNGEGIAKDLSGNELPNAPDMTATLTVDYTIPLANDWLLTLHGDAYRQSEAWTRIINSDPYDRLQPFEQINFAAIFANEDAGWNIMAYVKNALDQDNITGAFLNSDDTGLTTNVFLNEPRLYGLRVTKAWSGDPWWNVAPGAPGRRQPLTVELGGMATRVDAPNEVFAPDWVNEFTSSNLRFPIETQEEDLDWGDGREAKLTYRSAGGWQVAARARYGRTNGVAETWRYEFVEGPYYTDQAKYPGRPDDGRSGALSETRDQEKHTLVDFSVGRELGLGLFGEDERSTVSLGVRYAQFEGSSQSLLVGIPEYIFPTGTVDNFSPIIWNEYDSRFSRTGEFEGTGPMVSWEASKSLFPVGEFARANLDWSLSGGMLFGKQETSLEGDTRARYFAVGEFFRDLDSFGPTTVTQTTLTPRSESRDVEVPFFGASLGLSYEIDRFKVGAGYSWERFSDVMDGGIAEAKEVDRTIQGPYFRLSVGFGG
jgi:iron complex outermembrane receptor protein